MTEETVTNLELTTEETTVVSKPKSCCELVNENLANTVEKIETTLVATLNGIPNILNVGNPGLSIDVRNQKALSSFDLLLKQARDAYHKVLKAKCLQKECCESAVTAVSDITNAYADALSTKILNGTLLDGSQATTNELSLALDTELAANLKDLELVTSVFDCKKCKSEKPCCVVVHENLVLTVKETEEELVGLLTNISTIPNAGDPGVDVVVRQNKAIATYDKLLEQARDAYKKVLNAKRNEHCCESAAQAINQITNAYSGFGFTNKLLNPYLLDGSQVTVDQLGAALTTELEAQKKDLELVTSPFEEECKPRKQCEYKKPCNKYRVECPKSQEGKRRRHKKEPSSSSTTEESCDCKKK